MFGADGFLGSAILAGLSRVNLRCIGIGRRGCGDRPCLDLARPDSGSLQLARQGISHAVIAAGITGIAACERDPATTGNVNVRGTAELARQLQAEGIRVVALSSDYVFDGTRGGYAEDSAVNPLNEYGRQKVALENALLDRGGNSLVVRLSKVFDTRPGSGTLLDEMAGRMVRGGTVHAARDQVFCPTHLDDVVAVLSELLAGELTGIVHLCAPEAVSRLQVAGRVADAFGCDRELIRPISLGELPEAFARPLNTSMVCHRLAERFPGRFRTLGESVAQLKENYAWKQGGCCRSWPE